MSEATFSDVCECAGIESMRYLMKNIELFKKSILHAKYYLMTIKIVWPLLRPNPQPHTKFSLGIATCGVIKN